MILWNIWYNLHFEFKKKFLKLCNWTLRVAQLESWTHRVQCEIKTFESRE